MVIYLLYNLLIKYYIINGLHSNVNTLKPRNRIL